MLGQGGMIGLDIFFFSDVKEGVSISPNKIQRQRFFFGIFQSFWKIFLDLQEFFKDFFGSSRVFNIF